MWPLRLISPTAPSILTFMRRRRSRGPLWIAAYVVCFAVVLSFIFFEVLDVDGSDFWTPLHAASTIKLTEPPHEVRRAPLQVSIPAQAVTVVLNGHSQKLHARHSVDAARADTPAHTSLRRESRRTLARSLLPDPSPSA